MRRTSAALLLLLALVGGGGGYLANHLLTVAGRSTFTPSPLLPVFLLLLAAGAVAIAWPVRQSVRGGTRIDPFRAMRTATLARASSLLGALIAGFGAGLLLFLLSRPVSPPVGSTVTLVVLIAGSLVLIAAALVAESFCTLPKDSDDQSDPDDADAGPGIEH